MPKTEAEVTKELGQKLFAGWTMLGSHCPICSTVLVQQRGKGARYCCKCEVFLVTESEAKQHNLQVTDSFDDFQKAKNTPTSPQSQPSPPTVHAQEQKAPSLPTSSRPALPQPISAPIALNEALIDKDFEEDGGEEELTEDAMNATKQAYGDLKAMYSKLMGSSNSFLQANPFEAAVANISKYSVDTSEPDPEDPDEFLQKTGDKIKESIIKAGAMFEEMNEEIKDILPLPTHLVTHQHTGPATLPPDPDDDWEYYNSRETDNNALKQRIDQAAFAIAEQDFANRTLQGWIFSSHACPFCEQILLFPPSSSTTPEEIQEDVVNRYNQTLSYSPPDESFQVTSPWLNQDDVELDPCEFIRALCTYCGWYCIGDEDYIPTLSHECCACLVNLAAHDTRPEISPRTTPLTTQTTTTTAVPSPPPPTATTTTTTISSSPPTGMNDWSSRIQSAIHQAISSQSKSFLDSSDMSAEEFDFYNFDNIEETARLLNSDEVKRKVAHVDDISRRLSSAMGHGEMILDEYCPDCAVPLVGVISQDEYDKLSQAGNLAARSSNSQGMKLQINAYATMPKKCVMCHQRWNIEEEEKITFIPKSALSPSSTPAPAPVLAPASSSAPMPAPMPVPIQNKAAVSNLVTLVQTAPVAPKPTPLSVFQPLSSAQTLPLSTAPISIPHSQLASTNQVSNQLNSALSSHITALTQTLMILTQRITHYNHQVLGGETPTEDLLALMASSQSVSLAIAACQKLV